MNWDRIEGQWKKMKGEFRQKWADMTDSDFDKIGGKKDELAGWLQNKYGYGKDRATREIDDFANGLKDDDVSGRTDRGVTQ